MEPSSQTLTPLSESNYDRVYENGIVYLTPKQDWTETVIYLHGLGGNALKAEQERVKTGCFPALPSSKIVLVTAPKAKNFYKGGEIVTSWFDIKTTQMSSIRDIEENLGLDEAEVNSKWLKEIINEEIRLLNGDSKKVILAGNSQGCAMVLHLGLTFDKPLGGIIGLSGFLFPEKMTKITNDDIPIFLSHGKADDIVPFDTVAEPSYKRLDFGKHKVDPVFIESLGHYYNDVVAIQAINWLKQLTGR